MFQAKNTCQECQHTRIDSARIVRWQSSQRRTLFEHSLCKCVCICLLSTSALHWSHATGSFGQRPRWSFGMSHHLIRRNLMLVNFLCSCSLFSDLIKKLLYGCEFLWNLFECKQNEFEFAVRTGDSSSRTFGTQMLIECSARDVRTTPLRTDEALPFTDRTVRLQRIIIMFPAVIKTYEIYMYAMKRMHWKSKYDL